MTTLCEIAQEPEMQAAFAQLSPSAQRTMNELIALLDLYPLDAIERTLDRILAAADAPLPPPDPRALDDDPTITVIDDGQRSGVRLERVDWSHRAWLDFRIGENVPGYTSGRVMASVDVWGGQRPGLELVIWGNAITSSRVEDPAWTLADLRQLRDDLDRLLVDERLIGALAEQAI